MLLMIAFVFAVLYWVGWCYRPASLMKSFVKTASVAVLVIAAFGAEAPWLLVLALAFCALGDLLLSLDREAAFLAGVGAFAAGHLFYLFAIVGHPSFEVAVIGQLPKAFAAFGLAAMAVVMAVVLFKRAGDLRYAVLGYVPMITGLGLFALGLPNELFVALAILGAMLFVMSDTILAMEMFVLRPDSALRRITPFVIWGTYWPAQLLLLFGLT